MHVLKETHTLHWFRLEVANPSYHVQALSCNDLASPIDDKTLLHCRCTTLNIQNSLNLLLDGMKNKENAQPTPRSETQYLLLGRGGGVLAAGALPPT